MSKAPEFFTELAHQEGPESRLVHLSVSETSIRLHTYDDGATAKQIWGRDGEYDFWVEIEKGAFPQLLFMLLSERFAGQLDATDQMTAC